jgi:hypothetical protein
MRLVAALCFALVPGAVVAQTMTCRISAKYACGSESACKELKPTVWNVVDLTRQTYARCDIRGCDTYDAQVSHSGAFIVIDVPGRGMIAKLAANKSSFLEVVTAGTGAMNSFGACE